MRKSKSSITSARKALEAVSGDKYNAVRLCLTGLPEKSAPESVNFCAAKTLTEKKRG